MIHVPSPNHERFLDDLQGRFGNVLEGGTVSHLSQPFSPSHPPHMGSTHVFNPRVQPNTRVQPTISFANPSVRSILATRPGIPLLCTGSLRSGRSRSLFISAPLPRVSPVQQNGMALASSQGGGGGQPFGVPAPLSATACVGAAGWPPPRAALAAENPLGHGDWGCEPAPSTCMFGAP